MWRYGDYCAISSIVPTPPIIPARGFTRQEAALFLRMLDANRLKTYKNSTDLVNACYEKTGSKKVGIDFDYSEAKKKKSASKKNKGIPIERNFPMILQNIEKPVFENSEIKSDKCGALQTQVRLLITHALTPSKAHNIALTTGSKAHIGLT
ncbi:hypothetical protein AgCh_028080 [Apium graveolens]